MNPRGSEQSRHEGRGAVPRVLLAEDDPLTRSLLARLAALSLGCPEGGGARFVIRRPALGRSAA